MGGREYDMIRAGSDARPDAVDRARVLRDGVMILPSVEPGSGPFPGRPMRWTVEPATEGERIFALSLYLALMTETCLSLIGPRGPVIVEGPFARNADYLAMLSALRADGVETASSATGTSVGAVMLCLEKGAAPATEPVVTGDAGPMRDYAMRWQAHL